MFKKAKDFLKKYPEVIPTALLTAAVIYQAGKIHKVSYSLGLTQQFNTWLLDSIDQGFVLSFDERGAVKAVPPTSQDTQAV